LGANTILRHAAALALALLAAVVASGEHLRTLPSHVLWDFGSFYASAQAAARGLDPYAVYPLTFVLRLPVFTIENPNLNPPIFALLFHPLTLGEPEEMFRLWRWISIAFYMACASLLLERFRDLPALGVVAWLAGLAGFWDTLLLGQIYTPLVLCMTGAYLAIERGRPLLAGVLIGLVIAIKPNFLVIPVVLALVGHKRCALTSIAVFTALWLVALVVYGFDDYRDWISLLLRDVDRRAFPTNMSIWGLASRAGLPVAGLICAAMLLAGLALWALLRRPDARTAVVFAPFASLIASPLAWVQYSMFIAPVVLAYARQPLVIAGALLFMTPVPLVIGHMNGSLIQQLLAGSAYNWALLLCFSGVVIAERQRRSAVIAKVAAV